MGCCCCCCFLTQFACDRLASGGRFRAIKPLFNGSSRVQFDLMLSSNPAWDQIAPVKVLISSSICMWRLAKGDNRQLDGSCVHVNVRLPARPGAALQLCVMIPSSVWAFSWLDSTITFLWSLSLGHSAHWTLQLRFLWSVMCHLCVLPMWSCGVAACFGTKMTLGLTCAWKVYGSFNGGNDPNALYFWKKKAMDLLSFFTSTRLAKRETDTFVAFTWCSFLFLHDCI